MSMSVQSSPAMQSSYAPPPGGSALPPKPGSDAAMALGCKCARMDNHYGRGWGGDGDRFGWVISGDCVMHSVNRDGL